MSIVGAGLQGNLKNRLRPGRSRHEVRHAPDPPVLHVQEVLRLRSFAAENVHAPTVAEAVDLPDMGEEPDQVLPARIPSPLDRLLGDVVSPAVTRAFTRSMWSSGDASPTYQIRTG